MSSPLSIINEVQFAINVVSDEACFITTGFGEFLGPLDL